MFDFLPRSLVRGTGKSVRAMVIGGALLTSACHKKSPRVFVFPPVQHPAPEPLKVPADLNPPELDSDAALPADLVEVGSAVPEIQPPPAPPPPPPRARGPVATTPRPTPQPPVPPEPASPKIVQLFPAEQLRAYNKELDDILDRDQKTLETVARKNLNADLRERMAQIRELLTQAKQAREQDLLTAVNLAKRADTLATDLLARLP